MVRTPELQSLHESVEKLGSPSSVSAAKSGGNLVADPSGQKLKGNERKKIRNPCCCCCCTCCNLRANCAAIGVIQIGSAIVNAAFTTEVPEYCKNEDCANENAYIGAELAFITIAWLACLGSGMVLLAAVYCRYAWCALVAGVLILVATLCVVIQVIIHISLTFYINGRITDTQDTTIDEMVAATTILLSIVAVHSGLHIWMASCCFALRLQILGGVDRRAHVPPETCGFDMAARDDEDDDVPAFSEVPSRIG